MFSIGIYKSDNTFTKRINVTYFGYGEREFQDKLRRIYKFNEFLTREALVEVLNELEGRIGKKSSGLLLYYAFLNKRDNFQFKLER